MTTQAAASTETRLPRAVRERIARMNEQLAAAPAAAAPTPPAPPDAAAEADGAAAAASTDPNAPPAAPVAPPPAADPRENDPAYWRQRFSVTQGMLRSFQERQAEALAAKDTEIATLRDKIRELEASSRTSGKGALDLSAFFSPEQIEHFGEEQCRAMASAATAAAQGEAKRLFEAEVKPIQDRNRADAQRATESRENAFWEKLAELVPDFQEVNASPSWLEWLATPDETTGLVRQDILDRHRQSLNANGVAQVFQRFKAGQAKPPAPPVAPPRGVGPGSADTPAAPQKAYPSPKEIKDFYTRAAIGKVSDKERVEFEARLRSRTAA
ncbi:MAG: hypothetical protein KF863_21440 [Rubrivivax sp.]|nr:hypothetical protein [Rubrivivax sp.]